MGPRECLDLPWSLTIVRVHRVNHGSRQIQVAREEQVLRFGVFLILVVSFGSVTPSLAQSLQAQEYYFNRVENAWEPLPARERWKARDDTESVKFLELQEYRFNSVDNAWEPRTAAHSARRGRKRIHARQSWSREFRG